MKSKNPMPTPEECERALFIDFEGTAVDPPSFLGATWLDGDTQHFVQYVLEEYLWPAVEAKSDANGGHCRVATWEDLSEIRQLAQTENRKVFAWSTHEATDLGKYVPGDDGIWFSENVINAIPIAKAWKKKHHPGVVFKKDPKKPMLGKNSLDKYLKLIEYPVPKAFGPGNSAQRIRYVRNMLNKRTGNYSKLTTVAKAKWAKALKHNWHDCDGMRELLIAASADSSISKDQTR